MDERKINLKVYFVAIVFAFTTGLSFLGAKSALSGGTPLESLFFRFLISAAFALLAWKLHWVKADFKGKPLRRLLWPSVFYSLGFFGFQFFGLMYATSIEASLLFAIMPAFTMLIAEIFLREHPNGKQRFCVFITLLAVLFLFIFNNGGVGKMNLWGALLLLLSSLSMAANNVALRWVRSDFTPAEVSIAASILGCAVYTGVLAVSGAMSGTLPHTVALVKNPVFMLAVLYLGIVCTMLTTLMNAYLMIHLEAMKTSAFGNFGTLISVIAGAVVLHEPLNWSHIVCGAIIIFGVFGTNFFRGGKKTGMENRDQGNIEGDETDAVKSDLH